MSTYLILCVCVIHVSNAIVLCGQSVDLHVCLDALSITQISIPTCLLLSVPWLTLSINWHKISKIAYFPFVMILTFLTLNKFVRNISVSKRVALKYSAGVICKFAVPKCQIFDSFRRRNLMFHTLPQFSSFNMKVHATLRLRIHLFKFSEYTALIPSFHCEQMPMDNFSQKRWIYRKIAWISESMLAVVQNRLFWYYSMSMT